MSNSIENGKVIPGIRRLSEKEKIVREDYNVVNILPVLQEKAAETKSGMVLDKRVDLGTLIELLPGQIAELSSDLQRVVDLNGTVRIDYVGNISVYKNGHEKK